MCGISGYILKHPSDNSPARLLSMLNGVRQRGPDDEGLCLINRRDMIFRTIATERSHPAILKRLPLFRGNTTGMHDAALVHSRFAVIDRSAGGHQPFESQDGNIVLVFNGEIYNYLELRLLLEGEGVRFWTASDTEVLVEGYRLWKDELWSKLNGFWAIALYDRRDNRLVLSRDRLGVAPLYYRETDEGFFFSSLIDPLVSLDPESRAVDKNVLQGFIDVGFKDLDGKTVYQDIRSLPPAEIAVFLPGNIRLNNSRQTKYWSLPEKMLTENDISFDVAVRNFRDIFFDAVWLRLRADIKLGFELSGGLDSSSVTAAAAEISGEKLTTFTLKVRGRDEEPYARALKKRYNLDYRVVEGLEEHLTTDCAAFSRIMEEPYDTPANYTHHVLLKRIKADGIHVILTGAGGDETLAGYEASFWPRAYRQ